MQRTDSLEKTLILGKIEGMRRKGWQRMRWLDDITDSTDLIWASSKNWWWTGKPGMLQSVRSQRIDHDWATELNWGSHLPKSPLLHKAVSNVVKINFFSTLKANWNYATIQGAFNKEKYVKRVICHDEVWFILLFWIFLFVLSGMAGLLLSTSHYLASKMIFILILFYFAF